MANGLPMVNIGEEWVSDDLQNGSGENFELQAALAPNTSIGQFTIHLRARISGEKEYKHLKAQRVQVSETRSSLEYIGALNKFNILAATVEKAALDEEMNPGLADRLREPQSLTVQG